MNLINSAKNHFLLAKKLKNTESAQLWTNDAWRMASWISPFADAEADSQDVLGRA